MPLQTSRYLMTFSLVIVLICGFTLLDQLAGITKRPEAVAQVPKRSVRTTRSLQPTPPREPVFVETNDGYDYPEYENRTQQVPVHTASFANEFGKPEQQRYNDFGESDFQSQDAFEPSGTLDWPSDAMEPPVVPSGPAFDAVRDPVDSSVPGFAPSSAGFDTPAVEQEGFEPAAFEAPAAAGTDFAEWPEPAETQSIQEPEPETSDAFGPELPATQNPPMSEAGADAELGPSSDEPWDEGVTNVPVAQRLKEIQPVSITPVPSETPDAPRLLSTEASRGEAVRMIGFSTSAQIEAAKPAKSRAVLGSHRIRTAPVQNPERRIRGQFRFSAPPVETAPTRNAAKKPMASPATGCAHCRVSGQKVCPKCGSIHSK